MGVTLARRQILVGSGAIALSGCGLCRTFPSNWIPNPPVPPGSVNTILKPAAVAEGKKAFGLPYALDAHTHFFNGQDLNAGGYLAGPIAHSRDAITRDFMKMMAPVVDALVAGAPSAATEYQYLMGIAGKSRAGLLDGRAALDQSASQFRQTLAPKILKEMQRRNLDQEYVKRRNLYLGARPELLSTASATSIDQLVLNAIDPFSPGRNSELLAAGSNPPAVQTPPDGVLQFVADLLSYRWMSLRAYQQKYTEQPGAFGIDGAFACLVDFDNFLPPSSLTSRADQVKVQSLLSQLSGGYMLPLVSYNPWTDMIHAGEQLKLVQDAVLNFGFVGVKIYPGIGYFPYGNANSPLRNSSGGPRPKDLAALDARLAALFDWCEAQGVPVMAHADQSMGVDVAGDNYPEPDAWALVLKRYVGKAPPTINVGHFGGDLPNPQHQPPQHWPTDFAGLGKLPEGARLFGDLAYWDALTTCAPSPSADCTTAIGRLQDALAANPAMSQRIMYGTDWFMLANLVGWENYPTQLASALQQNLGAKLPLDRVFYRNAIDCFGLGSGGAQRARMSARLGGLPAWCDA